MRAKVTNEILLEHLKKANKERLALANCLVAMILMMAHDAGDADIAADCIMRTKTLLTVFNGKEFSDKFMETVLEGISNLPESEETEEDLN